MNEIDVALKRAIGDMSPGACFGSFKEVAPECLKCHIRRWCKPSTARMKSGQVSVPDNTAAVTELPDVDPLQHLLETLSAKYTMTVGTRGGIKVHYFKDGEASKVMVAVSKDSGKVNVRTASDNLVVTLVSAEQVEKMLSLLGV